MFAKDMITHEYWSKDSFKRKLERDKCFDLKRIDFSFNRITDDWAKTIATTNTMSEGVIGMEFFGTSISNVGLRIITEQLPYTLRTLDLSFIQFGPEGARILSETLRGHPTLQELDCCGCNIGTTGLPFITELLYTNPRIETIRLTWNNIDSEGGKIIAQMLDRNHSIQKLSLQHNSLTNTGIKYILPSLRNHPSLVELNLCSNKIDETACRWMLEILQTNMILQNIEFEEWTKYGEPIHLPLKDFEPLFKRNILEFQTQRRIACIQLFNTYGTQRGRDIEYYILKQNIFPMTGF